MKSICLLMTYYGPWPPWMGLFLESCRANPSIDWVVLHDCPRPESVPPNVRFVSTTLSELEARLEARLGHPFRIPWYRKLVDLRQAFGVVFADLVEGYDHWGHGDMDVIYGDLRAYLTDEVMRHSIISMHRKFLSGHLALYRNDEETNNLFRLMPDWVELFADPHNRLVDEQHFVRALGLDFFTRPFAERRWDGPPVGLEKGYYFCESWNTPRPHLTPLRRLIKRTSSAVVWRGGTTRMPDEWYWSPGHLTNNLDDVALPYLHFLHWKRRDWPLMASPLRAPEEELRGGFRVNRYGFFRPDQPDPPLALRLVHVLLCELRRLFIVKPRRRRRNVGRGGRQPLRQPAARLPECRRGPRPRCG